MADPTFITPSSRCFSCLSRNDEKQLQIYHIEEASLKSIFQTKQLVLCYICKKVAKNAERFIHNVETAQNVLKGIQNVADENVKSVMKLVLDLTVSLLDQRDVIEINSLDPKDDEKIKIEFEHTTDSVEMEVEYIKQEQNYQDENFENFINSIEEGYGLKEDKCLLKLSKKELKSKQTRVKREKKCTKPGRMKKKVKTQKNMIKVTDSPLVGEVEATIGTLALTTEQCLEERAQKRLDKSYLSCEFKCIDCIKGFSYKPSFEKHLEKHSKVSGDYECDICKLRVVSEDKLTIHRRCHTVRYRCTKCGLTRVCRASIEDHISLVHGAALQCKCPTCDKTFKCKSALRKHVFYAHKDKIPCVYCNKQYATKESLKSHTRRRHTTEASASKPVRKYTCKECGMAMESPSQLKTHSAKHSHRRDFYCVECDKSFKTYTSLQQHLKTVSVHLTQDDFKFPCPMCTKRFATKSHAERHVNDIHIKTARRFYCDQCGKEFRCKYKLASHIRAHEGYEKPRRFFCSVCNKGFHLKSTLDVHIRIHTGEKPFLCPACPAQFNQYGSLYNHKKLVHKIIGKAAKEETVFQDDKLKLGKKTKIDDVKFV